MRCCQTGPIRPVRYEIEYWLHAHSPLCSSASYSAPFLFLCNHPPLHHLCKLTTNSARHRQARVHIREEATWVLLDLPDVERRARVLGGAVEHSEWPLLTPKRDGLLLVSDGVGKGDARRSTGALIGLVDVGRRQSRGLVASLEAVQGDVPADEVLVAVDTQLVLALGSLEVGKHANLVDVGRSMHIRQDRPSESCR